LTHQNAFPFVVALTGGVASGKTATAQRFAQLGVPVFDADLIARELVAPGQPALTQIAAVFGRDMLSATGELERQRLRERVFADAAARRQLEAILHPPIRECLLAKVRSSSALYCVLAIPLLIECLEDYVWVDRVLTTDVPRAEQIIRLSRRDGIDAALAERVVQSQAPRERRLALANDVIDNTGPLSALDTTVGRLHQRYVTLAQKKLHG
jgi:dephospho-CoA kinase